jgi:hypothetical protein
MAENLPMGPPPRLEPATLRSARSGEILEPVVTPWEYPVAAVPIRTLASLAAEDWRSR